MTSVAQVVSTGINPRMKPTEPTLPGWLTECMRSLMREEVNEAIRVAVREEIRPYLAASRVETPRRVESLLTTREAAQLAGVHERTIREWISNNKLRRFKAGRELRVNRSDLEAFLAAPIARPKEYDVSADEIANAILNNI